MENGGPKSKVQSPKSVNGSSTRLRRGYGGQESKVQGPKSVNGSPKFKVQGPKFLREGQALALRRRWGGCGSGKFTLTSAFAKAMADRLTLSRQGRGRLIGAGTGRGWEHDRRLPPPARKVRAGEIAAHAFASESMAPKVFTLTLPSPIKGEGRTGVGQNGAVAGEAGDGDRPGFVPARRDYAGASRRLLGQNGPVPRKPSDAYR